MAAAPLILAALVNWFDASPVPGQCAEPAQANAGKPGCFLVGEMPVTPTRGPLWWHIYEFADSAAAAAAAARHPGAFMATSHGRAWLHLLGGATAPAMAGTRKASIGPLAVPPDTPLVARFIESVFTPGMRTRVHSHPGPEAFYVIEGEQCMETPSERRKVLAGESFVVPPGPHLQAAPKGRRNIAVIVYARNAAWMTMETTWTPSQFCAG